jgi:hypothetical protein
MGYQSSFKISAKLQVLPAGIKDAKVDLNFILKALKEVQKDESFYIRDQHITTDSDAVWYNATEELTNLSATMPGILLTCVRSGEEPGDIECTYHYNGKYQKAQMSFSEFNEDELKICSTTM